MTSNGKLIGCFQMRSYIDVVILTGPSTWDLGNCGGYNKKIREMSNA
ncbi:hypothetical protein Golax_017902 [Gossypium laxum]|uniref:Uncharacterized protein n=1 Tax=Gossypium laxum TaxID=34288 RepID=A0A7J8Z1P2_9ROSI|nr:hypothetical protein [Gossypium laxum]